MNLIQQLLPADALNTVSQRWTIGISCAVGSFVTYQAFQQALNSLPSSNDVGSRQHESKSENDSVGVSPNHMLAAQVVRYDEDLSRAISLNKVAVPKISDDEILVQVKFASINPGDWRIAKGTASVMQPIEFPHTLGSDFTGVIVKLGKNVKNNAAKLKYNFNIGSKVVGSLSWTAGQMGCFAEYVACRPENIIILPETKEINDSDSNTNMMTASGVGIAGVTSYKALIEIGRIDTIKKCKILILGGSTACGMFGIQIAKAYDASEICVTSSKVELCESLGATKVFNYKNVVDEKHAWYNVLKNGEFDIVYDCVATGGLHYRLCSENNILNCKHGQFITLVGDLEENMGVVGYATMASMAWKLLSRKSMSLFGSAGYTVVDFKTKQRDLELVFKLMSEKNIKVVTDAESPMPFNEKSVRHMFDKSETQRAHGKLILSFMND